MTPSASRQMPWSPWHDRLHKLLLANKALLPKGASLLLAVSGGQDSMVLTRLILDLQKLHDWKIQVWHGDHGWHKNSQQTALELQNWCLKQDLAFYSNRTSKKETSTEAEARHWRYQQLAKTAKSLSSTNKKFPCNYVLTGHTGSDRAETLLLHLARGADLTGLSSLQDRRILQENIYLVRPLLSFTREETSQICNEMHLPIWLDPSNQSKDFSRNRVRQEILPVLNELHPGCSLRIARVSERLNHYKEDQFAIAKLAIKSISKEQGLCRKSLCELPFTARCTILAVWMKDKGNPYLSTPKLEELSRKIEPGKSPGWIDLPKGWKFYWQKELVSMKRPEP